MCQSAIPPKYRPVPNKDKEKLEEEDPENPDIKEFWDNYHKMKERPFCKNCEKE